MMDATTLDTLHQALKGLTAVGIAGGVAKAFEWFEPALSKDAQKSLSEWLVNVPGAQQIRAWSALFPDLIDKLFGENPKSWRFFVRSCIASILAITVVSTLTILHYGLRRASEYPVAWSSSSTSSIPLFIVESFFTAIVASCVPDYFSLLASRWIVRKIAKDPRPIKVGLYLVLDSVLGIAIATLSVAAAAFYTTLKVLYDLHTFSGTAVLEGVEYSLFAAVSYEFVVPRFRVFIFASMFTSFWVWLYVLASGAIRALSGVRFIWVGIVPFLNVREKPLQAIGRVAGLVVAFVYLCAIASLWIAQHIKL